MVPASDERMLVVAEASVLINFLRAGRLDLLRHHEDYRIVVTEHVRREVRCRITRIYAIRNPHKLARLDTEAILAR